MSVTFAGKELTGWQVWVFGSLLAMIGVVFLFTGFYVLRRRKVAA
jgi:hypothetical protein